MCLVLGALGYAGSVLYAKRAAIRRRLQRRPGLNSLRLRRECYASNRGRGIRVLPTAAGAAVA